VDRLAAERGLGELAEVRADQSVRRALLQYWGMAVLGGLLLWVVGTVQDGVSVFSGLYSLLHAVVWFCFLVCLWGFVYGLRALILGSSAHYRYAQGLVFHRRSQLKAVTWQEVTRAKPVYGRKQQGAEGKVLGYELHTGEGLAFAVPLRLRNGKDTFVDAVLAQLQAHGCVVN